MISRASSTPVWLAASTSRTSTWREAAIATQGSHLPHGSSVASPVPSGPMQFRPRASSRAVEVLPTPRTPVRTKACASRPSESALPRVRTSASWPISSENLSGRYLRARTRYPVWMSSVMMPETYRSAQAFATAKHAKRESSRRIIGDMAGRLGHVGSGRLNDPQKASPGCFLSDLTG